MIGRSFCCIDVWYMRTCVEDRSWYWVSSSVTFYILKYFSACAHVHVCICVCVHVWMCVHVCKWMLASMFVYVSVCVCARTCVCLWWEGRKACHGCVEVRGELFRNGFSPTLFLRQSLLFLLLSCVLQASWPESFQMILLPCLHSLGGMGGLQMHSANLNSVLRLVWQALYLLSLSLAPGDVPFVYLPQHEVPCDTSMLVA